MPKITVEVTEATADSAVMFASSFFKKVLHELSRLIAFFYFGGGVASITDHPGELPMENGEPIERLVIGRRVLTLRGYNFFSQFNGLTQSALGVGGITGIA